MFPGKDGITVWNKYSSHPKTSRTRRENIIKKLPGPSFHTKLLKESLKIWEYFINDEMIGIIVDSTNKFINSIEENYARRRDATTTDPLEIRALIGLLYLAGVCHGNRLNREDIWNTKGYGIEMFHLTMSMQRFKFLLRCLRFDDKDTRVERASFDKLAAIRDIFNMFIRNCENAYHLSEFTTVDEMLVGFRGKCNFRQYIPSKPNKYGIKVFALCDAKMFYTSTMEAYVGMQPDGPFKLSNSPPDVVLRLCRKIYGSGRNLTIDNWFTSVPLVKKLVNEHRITVIGTVRKNKRELPIEFSNPVARPQHTSMFAFTRECTLVSYMPKKKKNVLAISSMHHDDKIDDTTGDLKKPNIITTYNSTKGGVDVVDKLTATYNCTRNTRRWPMILFYHILNIAGINSQVIFVANNRDINILRRNFLRDLADNLIAPYLKIRATMSNLPRGLKTRLQDFSRNEPEAGPSQAVRPAPPGRCTYCDWKKNRKSRFSCFNCATYMCLEHITPICQECRRNAFQNE